MFRDSLDIKKSWKTICINIFALVVSVVAWTSRSEERLVNSPFQGRPGRDGGPALPPGQLDVAAWGP